MLQGPGPPRRPVRQELLNCLARKARADPTTEANMDPSLFAAAVCGGRQPNFDAEDRKGQGGRACRNPGGSAGEPQLQGAAAYCHPGPGLQGAALAGRRDPSPAEGNLAMDAVVLDLKSRTRSFPLIFPFEREMDHPPVPVLLRASKLPWGVAQQLVLELPKINGENEEMGSTERRASVTKRE